MIRLGFVERRISAEAETEAMMDGGANDSPSPATNALVDGMGSMTQLRPDSCV